MAITLQQLLGDKYEQYEKDLEHLKSISAYSLPDNPSQQEYGPKVIKKKNYDPLFWLLMKLAIIDKQSIKGSTWYSGHANTPEEIQEEVVSAGNIPKQYDKYLNETTNLVWEYDGKNWIESDFKLKGQDGNLIRSGNENPTEFTGWNDGDLFINTQSFYLYQYNGSELVELCDMKGDDGFTPDIALNVSATNTTGTPSVSVSKSGDLANQIFSLVFSGLKGERGEKGAKGDKGDTGPQGPKGQDGATFVQEGMIGLDIIDGDLVVYTAKQNETNYDINPNGELLITF